jgi:glutaredoxin-like protein NrdH
VLPLHVAYVTILEGNTSRPQQGNEKRGFVMTRDSVKMYSLSTCSHCKATKKLLDECTIAYEFTDVDLLKGKERAAILEDVKKFNPNCSFPTIIIGDKVIVGYKEKEIKEALGLA